MKELSGSETLEQEIETSARKKTQKLLQDCEIECASIKKKMDDDLESEIALIVKKNQLRLSEHENKLQKRIPLEKNRMYVSYISKKIIDEIDAFFDDLTIDEKISLISRSVIKSKEWFLNDSNVCMYSFFSEEKICSLIQNIFPSCVRFTFEKIELEHDCGIILKSGNGNTILRATLSEEKKKLMSQYRGELALALTNKESM